MSSKELSACETSAKRGLCSGNIDQQDSISSYLQHNTKQSIEVMRKFTTVRYGTHVQRILNLLIKIENLYYLSEVASTTEQRRRLQTTTWIWVHRVTVAEAGRSIRIDILLELVIHISENYTKRILV